MLLTAFAATAEREGWIVAQVEAGQSASIREAIGEALHPPLAQRARPGAGARLVTALRTALGFEASYDSTGSWSFGLGPGDPSAGPSATGVLETDLTALVRDGLAALCAPAHVAGQRGWRFLLALAGLPSLPRVLTEAKSYAERLFEHEVVERLDDEQARRALLDPARAAGASWEDDALSLITAETKGHPYFLQQMGTPGRPPPHHPSPWPTPGSVRSPISRRSTPAPDRAGNGPRAASSAICGPWPRTATPGACPARWRAGWASVPAASARPEPRSSPAGPPPRARRGGVHRPRHGRLRAAPAGGVRAGRGRERPHRRRGPNGPTVLNGGREACTPT